MKHTRAPNGITPRSQFALNQRFHALSPSTTRALRAWAAARAAYGQKACSSPDCSRSARTH
eukprot:2943881-Alexandrium_andersonii.AAC.1